MISASHNPPEYNGIKIFDQNGKKLKKIYEENLEQAIQEKIRFDGSLVFGTIPAQTQRIFECKNP